MLYFGRRRVTCFVVFHGSIMGGPWTLWTRPAWRHALLLLAIYFPAPGAFASRYTIRVEPTAWGVDLDAIWKSPEQVAREYYEAGVTAIVKITVDLPPARIFALRGFITCISVIKAALGIRAWRVLTPFALYNHLIRNGGELVNWEEGDAAILTAEGARTRRSDAPGAAGARAAPARA